MITICKLYVIGDKISMFKCFRLRHERNKPIKIDRGGPSEYQMLETWDLEPTPQPSLQPKKRNKDDPLDFYVD